MSWTNDQSIPTTVLKGGQAIVDLLQPIFPVSQLPKFTVIRAILDVGMQGSSFGLDWFGAFGISVITRDALAAGAVPDPITDFVDWYWHKSYYDRTDTGAGAAVSHERVDLRSARQIRGVGRTMAFIFDVNSGSTGDVIFSVSARLLLAH